MAKRGFFTFLLACGILLSASRTQGLQLLDPVINPVLDLLNIPLGSDVVLRAETPGSTPLTYQWLLNGVPLIGETNSTLSIENVTLFDGGSYDVVAVDTNGVSRSQPGILTLDLPQLGLNDNFNSLLPLLPNSSRSGAGRGSNVSATRQPGEPQHGKKGFHSVWFRWKAPNNGVVTFKTAGSTFDTLLAAYVGTAVDALQPVAKDVLDDDEGGFHTSVITFNASAGTLYRIAIDGLGQQSGEIVLSWDLDTSSPPVGTLLETPLSKTYFLDTSFSLNSDYSGASINCEWLFNGVRTGVDAKDFDISRLTPAQVGRYTMVMRNSAGKTNSTVPVDIQISSDPSNVDPKNVQAMNKFFEVHDLAERYRTNSRQRSSMLSRRIPVTTPATGYRGTQIFNTAGATKDPGEPMFCNVLGGASEWFSYYATNNGTLHLNTDGSSFDTILAVFTDPTYQGTFASIVEVACDNNSGRDGQDSGVRIPVAAGTLYYVAVDGVNAATGIAYLNYNLGNPPTLLESPVSQSVPVGQPVTFQARATGSTNLNFLWFFNGALLTNEPTGLLNLSSVQLQQQGNYQVVVSNQIDCVTSAVVSLTVFTPATITELPISQVATAGQSVSFSVQAAGTPTLFYQWFQNSMPVPGATTAVLELSNLQSINGGSYQVVVSNFVGSVTSAPATLVVNTPPSINSSPSGTNLLAGGSVTLSVAASGSEPLRYQWRRGAEIISGATNSTLLFSSIEVSQQGNYSVVVNNDFGSITSQVALVEVQPLVAPVFVLQPQSGSALAGSNLSFNAVATSSYPVLYQWFKGSDPIPEATAATLTLTNLQVSSAGSYRVLATNSLGGVLSDAATLTINTLPSIITQPVGTNVLAGSSINLSIEATGSGPLRYQWRQEAETLVGATNAALLLSSIEVSQQGNYSVVVNNDFGSITSLVALVEVQAPVPPLILVHPQSGTGPAGSDFVLNVSTAGSQPLFYQWFIGTNALDGATAQTLALNNFNSLAEGSYSVQVSNAFGMVASQVADIYVDAPLRLVSVRRGTSTTHLRIVGLRGVACQIEGAEVSLNWSSLLTNNAVNGIIDWAEETGANSIRFYRARQE